MTFRSPRHYLREAAERQPARTALRQGARSYDYEGLSREVHKLRTKLTSAGIGPGTQVAIVLPNSCAFVIIYAALLEAGATLLALPPSLTNVELAAILKSSGVVYLFAPSARFEEQPADAFSVVVDAVDLGMDGVHLRRCAHREERIDVKPWTEDGIVMRRLSSGSTGTSKRVSKRERALHLNVAGFCQMLGLREGEVFLGCAPFFHGFGAKNVLGAFYLGGCIEAVPRFLPAMVLEVAASARPTVFLATPPMLDALSRCVLPPGTEHAFASLRACPVGGSRLSRAVHDAFAARFGVSATLQYGTVETHTATIDVDEGFEEGRVGRCLPGVEVAVFAPDGERCGPGAEGDVAIRGETVSRGYDGESGPGAAPRTDQNVFRAGWVFPGDRGFLDPKGRLHLTGRRDLINIGGDKVDRTQVEAVIRAIPGVREAIVDGTEHQDRPVVRAWVEASPGEVTHGQIIDRCREHLSAHKVPSVVVMRDEFPRNEAGKVVRERLLRSLD